MSVRARMWVVGAGGLGREVWGYAREHPDCGVKWELAGFLDDKLDALDQFPHVPAVASTIRDFDPREGGPNLLLCGLGIPEVKERCVRMLEERGGEFLRLIHPTAVVGEAVSWGRGGVVAPGVILTTDIVLGDHVLLNCQTAVGHDARIGSWSTLSSFCDVTGGVEIGERVFAGSRVSLIPGVKVGEGAVLGAGAVVIRDLPGKNTYFGVPARPLGR